VVELPVAAGQEHHVVFDPGDEVNAGALLSLAPLSEVDTGSAPDVENLAPGRGTLAQGVDGLALERTHLVLLLADVLIGHAQVGESVAAQVESALAARVLKKVLSSGQVSGRVATLPA